MPACPALRFRALPWDPLPFDDDDDDDDDDDAPAAEGEAGAMAPTGPMGAVRPATVIAGPCAGAFAALVALLEALEGAPSAPEGGTAVVRRVVRLVSVARTAASREPEAGVAGPSPSSCAVPRACVNLSTWRQSGASVEPVRSPACDSKGRQKTDGRTGLGQAL